MYLGRIVAIGMNKSGRVAAMYRVSSRSFPNREAVLNNGNIAIVPRAGFEGDLARNPYITYNCVRLAGDWAVATNGSHTDPVVEKLAMNYPGRDALALSLLAMDYEKDSLDTPRVAAAVNRRTGTGCLGVVRKDAVLVREFELKPGVAYYLSTYECNAPCVKQVDHDFDAPCVNCAAAYVVDKGVFANFENPVCGAAALATDEGFELAVTAVK